MFTVFQVHTAYEFLSDGAKRARYDHRYTLIQRRWTQYRKWEQAEEQRRARQEELKSQAAQDQAEMFRRMEDVLRAAEDERRRKEDAARRARAEDETRRTNFQKDADARRARFRQEANFARQQDASAVTPCVHAHIGNVWWKNGRADCSFCDIEGTFCYRCPVCDVAACPDCRADLPC